MNRCGGTHPENQGCSACAKLEALRDQFAGMAMQGVLAADSGNPNAVSDMGMPRRFYREPSLHLALAEKAYAIADAMMKARSKP